MRPADETDTESPMTTLEADCRTALTGEPLRIALEHARHMDAEEQQSPRRALLSRLALEARWGFHWDAEPADEARKALLAQGWGA